MSYTVKTTNNTDEIHRAKNYRVDKKQIQNHLGQSILRKIKQYETGKAKPGLSFGERVLQRLKNNTSRMMGDYHVRF